MKECLAKIAELAGTEGDVLLLGEPGTDKVGLARRLHGLSRRKSGPFVFMDVGAIPEALVESELFGNEQDAFTGADRSGTGKLELASGGTLFLDEIGDAPEPVQARLLRVLESRPEKRAGGTEDVRVDVRVIAGCSRLPERGTAEGRFRADLTSRLAAHSVRIPPLRQRPEDVVPLARDLLRRHAERMRRDPPEIPAPAAALLRDHDWPGNEQELEEVLVRALIATQGDKLRLQHPLGRRDGREIGSVELPPPARFDDMVREILRRALAATGGRIYGPHGAAALLDLKPTTLQSKLKRYGLHRREFTSGPREGRRSAGRPDRPVDGAEPSF